MQPPQYTHVSHIGLPEFLFLRQGQLDALRMHYIFGVSLHSVYVPGSYRLRVICNSTSKQPSLPNNAAKRLAL